MSTQASRARRGSIGVWVILGGAGVLVLGFVLVLSTFMFGWVNGQEVSPDTFDRRSFFYCEIPLFKVQITPVRRVNTGKGFESYLAADTKLIPASTAATPRYDLVRMNNVKPESDKCDARILCFYFDSMNESGTSYWLEWTKQNPELAKVLWPIVAKAARQQLYIFVPDLIESARQATNAKQFQRDLELVLAKKYLEFAELQQQLDRHDDAVKLYTEAITHDPQSTSAFLGRAKSHEALGQGDSAAADLAEAVKLGKGR